MRSRINFDLFKFNLKRNKGLLFVFTLLLSLTFPVIILVSSLSKRNYSFGTEEIQIFMVWLSLGFIFLLVLTPFIFFNYLNSKKSVDVYHSLSITRNDLFITFFSLSLFFVIVPLTLAYWGGFILTYLATDVAFDPYHIFHYGRLLMVSIAITAPSIFVMMNTGTISDSLVYTGILIVAPFIAYGAYQLFAQSHIIGFKVADFDVLAYLSPLAGIFYIFESASQSIDGHFIASYWLLLGFTMNCFSMNLYKDWKSESSETPFSNNVFFPFVSSLFIGFLFIFLISINFFSENQREFLSFENLLIPVIFTYALFLILNIIKLRSINTFKKSTKDYLILFTAIMILTNSLYYTQGFGFAYHIPKEEEIVSIDIQAHFLGEPILVNDKINVKNSDTIKEILDIHQQIVTYVKEDKNLFKFGRNSELKDSLNIYGPKNSYSDFSLTYNLKNKDTVRREYSIPIELQHMFFTLVDEAEIIHKNHPISDLKNTSISFVEAHDPFFSESYSFDFDLESDEFRSAIENDLLAMDEESYFQSPEPIQMVLVYGLNIRDSNDEDYDGYYDYRTYQLNIDSRFKETMNYLGREVYKETITSQENYYEIERASNLKDVWVGHGISQLFQQNYHGYYGNEFTGSTVNLDAYRDKIYDKRLSKDTNDVLIIDTMYGRTIYPIIND